MAGCIPYFEAGQSGSILSQKSGTVESSYCCFESLVLLAQVGKYQFEANLLFTLPSALDQLHLPEEPS